MSCETLSIKNNKVIKCKNKSKYLYDDDFEVCEKCSNFYRSRNKNTKIKLKLLRLN